MTIVSTRIYYYPRRQALERYLSATHWGFAEWFKRRLKPLREQLRGPEAKGVDIVNFMLCEPSRTMLGGRHTQWHRSLNSFQFTFACELEPLRDQPPIDNIERLMRFAGAWAEQAPWPQVRAIAGALATPLDDADRASLLPFLTWPREAFFRSAGFEGERLEFAMDKARREMRPVLREARYPGAAGR
jgi:hypothetical protein